MSLPPCPTLVLLCCVGLLPLPGLAATVVFVKGTVFLETPDQGKALERGMHIPDDAQLQSHDGFAQLRRSDGLLLSLRPGDSLDLGAHGRTRDDAERSDSSALKAVLQRTSGDARRASRITLPENLQASGDVAELGIINSLNFAIPDVEGGSEPEFGLSVAGASAGHAVGQLAPALSNRLALVNETALEPAVYQVEIQRLSGSSIYPVDQIEAGSLAEAMQDTETGISWGRWAEGRAYDREAGADYSLRYVPLHAIVSAELAGLGENGEIFVTPLTGRVHYTLIGGTAPTDNLGRHGALGQASLEADFDSGRVEASVSLTIADRYWSASGDGSLGTDNQFSGAFSRVLADDMVGQGRFEGFFQNAADLNPGQMGGAGLAYLLEADGHRVAGALAFRQTDPAP